MEGRPKKPLSLKQRKLAFQSISFEKKPVPPKISQASPICKDAKQVDDPVKSGAHENDPLPNQLATGSGLHISGLCNLGNTCYANSVLQVLRFCPGFCAGVVKMESEGQDEGDENESTLSHQLARLWQRMSVKEQTVSKSSNKINTLSATKPDEFLTKLREENSLFNNKAQHDTQEMLRFLLSNVHDTYASREAPPTSPTPLHSDPNPAPTLQMNKCIPNKRKLSAPNFSRKYIKLNSGKGKKIQSFFNPIRAASAPPRTVTEEKKQPCHLIPHIFQGSLAYETHCFECENTTRRSETFLDVSVPVSTVGFPGFPPLSSPIKTTPLSFSASLVGPYSLSWCLSQFALREKLRGDNKYHCDECGRLTEAERSLLFSELPIVVTIHLNRFVAQAWGHSSSITVSKIGGNVAVPLTLNFKPWTTEDCKRREKVYTLFAIVFHSGSSCTSGHYTTCVRGNEALKVTCDKDTEQYCNSWLYFDDENVELISQNEVCSMLSPLSDQSSTAYILFYTCKY